MIKIGVVGCGLQAATIASYVGVYGDEYEVVAVADMNIANMYINCFSFINPFPIYTLMRK